MREGTRVDKYMRGEGKAPRVEKQAIGAASLGGTRWRVTREGHSVTVAGADIVQGMARGVDLLPAAGQSVTVQRI